MGMPTNLPPSLKFDKNSDSNLLYPTELDPRTFNPYETGEPYRETNLLYTRFPNI